MASPDFATFGFSDTDAMMLNDAFQACTCADAWNWLRAFDEDSFMECTHPKLAEITKNMQYRNNHSKSSFGWVMMNMEYYAKNGVEAYIVRFGKK